MQGLVAWAVVLAATVAGGGLARAEETSRSVICGMIDRAAAVHALPPSFLTRLIWRESSFRPGVRSRAGAQGIAQFMPATANERGLVDPFDPESAIPASASYLSELRGRFGSLDLAAAAYNAGPGRIARWKAGEDTIPSETLAHVRFVTGADLARDGSGAGETETDPGDCLTTLASIRKRDPAEAGKGLSRIIAPWGVQLTGGLDKNVALRDYEALRRNHPAVLRDLQPTVLATRLGGRGKRSHYRIRVAFEDRASASALCRSLRREGAPCLLVRN